MANYQRAIRPYPSLSEIRTEFYNQTDSDRFSDKTKNYCSKIDISVDELIGLTIGYLSQRPQEGIEDLEVFMEFLIMIYKLNESHNSPALYELVKGIPSHSKGRVGYTFNRRKAGNQRGVFIFLL